MSAERSLQSVSRAIASCSRRRCRYSATAWNIRPRDEHPIRRTGGGFTTRHPTIPQSQPIRTFSTTAQLHKKGGKAARDERQATGNDSPSEDPNDFSALESDIQNSIQKLKDDLSKLRAGGRFNPEVVENLKVQPDKNNKQTVKLSDLAQVIPKGRTVQILVGEKDHLKPITSSIQSSTLSLTPQPDPSGTNPLLLILNIPPPTTESRRAVVNEATKAGEKASTSIKDSRSRQQKKLNGLKKDKSVRPDDLKKAGDKMEKVVEQGQAEVKRVVDSAKKVLESG